MDNELNAKEIKVLVSSIILTIGICGLLYSLPSFQHPMHTKFMGISLGVIFSTLIFLTGLVSKFIISKQYEKGKSELKLFASSTLRWKKSVHFAIISLTLFLSLFIFTNPTPGYAPHTFAYNIGFLTPVFWTSFGFSIIGLIMFLSVDKWTRKNIKWIFKLLPIASIIPFGLSLLWNIGNW